MNPRGCCGCVVASARAWGPRLLTDRKAWTMSALMLLRGLSFSTRKICSSLSKEMKFPNQERFASLSRRGWLEAGQEGAEDMKNLPPSLLFSSPSHSLWRGLRRQTGHLLGGGHWGGESMVDTCPPSSCAAQSGRLDPVFIPPAQKPNPKWEAA